MTEEEKKTIKINSINIAKSTPAYTFNIEVSSYDLSTCELIIESLKIIESQHNWK